MEYIDINPEEIITILTSEDGQNIEETRIEFKYLFYVEFFRQVLDDLSRTKRLADQPMDFFDRNSDRYYHVINLTVLPIKKWWLEEYLRNVVYSYPMLVEMDEKANRIAREIKNKYDRLRRNATNRPYNFVDYDTQEKEETDRAVAMVLKEHENDRSTWDIDEILKRVYSEGTTPGEIIELDKNFGNFVDMLNVY